jgi:death-on-curing protein
VDHVLAIHAQQLERFGGSHGVLHPGALESAVARHGNRFRYESPGLAELAAGYLVGLIRAHAFTDANKRTGTASMLVFLRINGHRLHVPQPELYALAMDVANGRVTEPQAAEWLRQRI